MNLSDLTEPDARTQVEAPPEVFGVGHQIITGEAVRNEIDAVGIEPIPRRIEGTEFASGFVEFRTWKRLKECMLGVVQLDGAGEVDGFLEGIMRLTGVAEDEVAFGHDPRIMGGVDGFSNLLLGDVLPHRVNDPLAAGFNPVLNHPATGLLHLLHHIDVHEVHTGTAAPSERQLFPNDDLANLLQPGLAPDEEIVIEKEVRYTVTLPDILHQVDEVLGGVVAVPSSHHTKVAEGTFPGASSARD